METQNKIDYLPASYYEIDQDVFIENIGFGGVCKTISISHFLPIPCLEARLPNGYNCLLNFNEIKPILRRLDSMTGEESESFNEMLNQASVNFKNRDIDGNGKIHGTFYVSIDWLDAHNFDRPRLINGAEIESLIDAGLAIDAATLEGEVK